MKIVFGVCSLCFLCVFECVEGLCLCVMFVMFFWFL